MYGIKFGPNVTHLVLMFYPLLQMFFFFWNKCNLTPGFQYFQYLFNRHQAIASKITKSAHLLGRESRAIRSFGHTLSYMGCWALQNRSIRLGQSNTGRDEEDIDFVWKQVLSVCVAGNWYWLAAQWHIDPWSGLIKRSNAGEVACQVVEKRLPFPFRFFLSSCTPLICFSNEPGMHSGVSRGGGPEAPHPVIDKFTTTLAVCPAMANSSW